MKKTVMQLVCLGMAGVLFTSGCTLNRVIPKTTVTGSIGGKPFSVSSPKDSDLVGLEITADTNGAVHVSIQKLTARMNPDVITTTGDAQAKLVKSVGDAVTEALGAAGQAAGQAAGAAVK